MHNFSLPLLPPIGALQAVAQATFAERVTLAGMHINIPGALLIRLSVVLSNLRMQRMLDALVNPGDMVVDVGANIGYNTLYAAFRVGPTGRVYAIEPAQDNLQLLYANLYQNNLRNVIVLPYAAGDVKEVKRFYLRGDVSAVNSLFQDNFYHRVTQTVDVLAIPLDELIRGTPALVKIDVEGGELEVLAGMPRLLSHRPLTLIIEWHPALQQAAGHEPDTLPLYLLDQGFTVQVVSHTHTQRLFKSDIASLAQRLLLKRTPVELLALH